MGQGFKNFGAEVLTSGHVDGYLMHQVCMHFDSAAARDTALSGSEEDGMLCYVRDINAYYFYDSGITLPAAGTGGWRPWYSQWGTYTPAWTNLTIGNGTTLAVYRWEFGSIHFRGQITLGASSTVDGTVSMAIPDSRTGDGYSSIGQAIINDAGTRLYVAQAHIAPSSTAVNFVHSEGGVINATSPMTWAINDVLGWDIVANPTIAG